MSLASPKLLISGFGPFPGAPENPTEALVRALADEPPEHFGASALLAVVLPTEYRRSWPLLRRTYARFEPDAVVHFGLSGSAETIQVERLARKRIDRAKLDAAGHAPAWGLARRAGPETLSCTFPAEAIVAALIAAGFPAALSDDAGGYVCNATLYRSLSTAPAGRMVGFIHIPPMGRNGFTHARLSEAAGIVLRAAVGVTPLPKGPKGEGAREAGG